MMSKVKKDAGGDMVPSVPGLPLNANITSDYGSASDVLLHQDDINVSRTDALSSLEEDVSYYKGSSPREDELEKQSPHVDDNLAQQLSPEKIDLVVIPNDISPKLGDDSENNKSMANRKGESEQSVEIPDINAPPDKDILLQDIVVSLDTEEKPETSKSLNQLGNTTEHDTDNEDVRNERSPVGIPEIPIKIPEAPTQNKNLVSIPDEVKLDILPKGLSSLGSPDGNSDSFMMNTSRNSASTDKVRHHSPHCITKKVTIYE